MCVWTVFIEVLGLTQRIPTPTQACTRETGVKTQITLKIEPVLDQKEDPSNKIKVSSNAHLSENESQLYIFEYNEAVKNDHQRQKSDDETRFPHPPSCPGLVM